MTAFTANERAIRRLYAVAYAGNFLKTEDGELLDESIVPFIDFLRDAPEMIQLKMQQRELRMLSEVGSMPPMRPTFIDLGLAVEHNMPCAVLGPTRHAVFNTSRGVFQPSGAAQMEGWYLIRATTKFQQWLYRKFFKGQAE